MLSALGAAVVILPLAYAVSNDGPRFRTTAVILLEAKPTNVPLFQELSPFRPLSVQLAILHSRTLAESVIDVLPRASFQELLQNRYHVDWMGVLKNTYLRLRGFAPEVESPQLQALKELQLARMTFNTRRDGIVDISAEASRPNVATDLAATYIEVLLSRTRSFNVDDARVSREFLEHQLGEVKKNLSSSEEALRQFVAASGGIKIPDRSQAAVVRLSQVESSLAEAEANRKMMQTRLQGLRAKVDKQKREAPPAAPVTPAPDQPASPLIPRLREQLVQLEKALIDLRMKYTEEHPRVTLVKDRIAEIQGQLGSAVKETVNATPAPGAVPPTERISFAEQVVALETSVLTISAQEDALRREAESLRRALSGLSRGEIEYSRLTREVESNRNLHSLLADKLAAARIREQGEMKVVKIIDPPSAAVPVANTRRLKFVGAALMMALLIGGALPAAAEILGKKVETDADVERDVDLPVLALIPRVKAMRPLFGVAHGMNGRRRPDESFMLTEAFRSLRVTLQIMLKTENIRSLLITSPFPGEGKSVTAMNLALAFSEVGCPVVLADTDFARPALTRLMKAPAGTSVLDGLSEQRSLEQSLAPIGDSLWLARQNAALQPRARGLLATERLHGLVSSMTDRADLVICDSPPTLLVPETRFLAAANDGVILVAKAGMTSCRELARAKEVLEAAGAKVLGVVINEMPVSALRSYYSRYYHSYVRSDKK